MQVKNIKNIDFKNIPNSALQFVEDTPISGTVKDGEKGVKVHLKARSRNAINHWYFGKVIHDFGSCNLPSKLALDDSHGVEIGYARPSITAWGLELDGVVIPSENKDHESNRILYNLTNGIPQQASIDFSGDYEIFVLNEGEKMMVNGAIVEGEAVVIQNWTLRACAICKCGADASTETEAIFSNKTFNLKNIKGLNMENEGQKPDEKDVSKIEELTAVAEVKADDVKAEVEKVENEAVKVDELAQIKANFETLKAEFETVKSAKVELENKFAEAQNVIQTFSCGVAPVQSAEFNGKSIIEQFNEIKDAVAKRKFYEENKKNLNI